MKNSTTAFILATMCMIANTVLNMPEVFIAICIFTATHLILEVLEENGSKL